MKQNFTHWIATIILTLLPAFVPAFAYAQNYQAAAAGVAATAPSGVVVPSVAVSGTPQRLLKTSSAALTTWHTRCDTQITTRLTSLTQALSRLNSIRKLSTDQKQQYTTAIQSNITGLTSLQAKCDADTDATTLQADTKSIVTSYRIYLEFIPQTALLAAADRLNDITDQLTILWTKLQTRIANAQSQGNNVTNLQTELSDMQTKLADVKTQTSAITTQIGSLQPSSVNTDKTGTKTDFQTARTALQTAQADVKAALSDAKLIVAGVEVFKTAQVNTSTPSAATTTVIPSSTIIVTPSVVPAM